ncbi:MAG: endonuclease/exonuclease/phosphatase family protein [Thermocrispum sp.]
MTVIPGDFDEPIERQRRPGGPVFTWFLALLATLFAGLALWRLVGSGLFGWDGFELTAVTLALTPYVAAGGVLLTLFIAVFRRWGSAVVVFALTAALGLTLLPRYIGDAQPGTGGPILRVLAVNMYFGEADPAAIVAVARARAVDVVALSEMTPAAAAGLEQAGLSELLPHQHFQAAYGASGSGIASRYPLRPVDLVGPTTFQQPNAALDVGGRAVEVVAVHSLPPVTRYAAWASDLRSLPRTDKQGAIRVLAGDFNASLDHAEFRRLLDLGYVDAADQLGMGLVATWPQRRSAPPVTLDHVLVDSRAAVRGFRVVDISGSDHLAVLATLQLPAP